MAVKGFNVGGAINRYDFNSLVNKEGAVTAEMLGSDVTTQLTTMSGNISTLQSQVATLNDGYAKKDITQLLTVTSGWTVYGHQFGHLVVITFIATQTQTLYNQYITLCTLPASLRPVVYMRYTAYDNNATSANSMVSGVVSNTSGNVQVWPYYTGTKPCGTVCFLVD